MKRGGRTLEVVNEKHMSEKGRKEEKAEQYKGKFIEEFS